MDFQQAVEYLTGLQAFGWRLDLSRMEALCARLGHPERAFKVVHVAGTNGKGSTTAMIAAILAAAGYRTGSYFSPYVFNVRERVMLAQPHKSPAMIPEADFARLMTELRPHVEAVAADETIGHPTEFEVKTALAFLYFREQQVDWAVMEVGLGGRLDATNVVEPEVCAITNIGMDHMERLGNTLEEIAGEKAGIIKPGAAVVTAATEPALGVIRKTYEERGGAEWGRTWQEPGRGLHGVLDTSHGPERFHFHVGALGLPLYQQMNAALAELTAAALRARGTTVPREATDQGVRTACLPGRFQTVCENPTVILDGAHNADGAAALAASLRRTYGDRPITLVLGMMGRHSIEGVMAALAPVAGRIIATQPNDERRLPAERVVEEAAKHGFEAPLVTPPMEALRRALSEAAPEEVIVVTGSFYVVGEIDIAALRDAGH
jgi:dihydrofolate synthase/folylpolyglutamate synthase